MISLYRRCRLLFHIRLQSTNVPSAHPAQGLSFRKSQAACLLDLCSAFSLGWKHSCLNFPSCNCSERVSTVCNTDSGTTVSFTAALLHELPCNRSSEEPLQMELPSHFSQQTPIQFHELSTYITGTLYSRMPISWILDSSGVNPIITWLQGTDI